MGVRAYLVTQVATVVAMDRALHTEALASVHDARVAVRRVRSVLRVFPELSDDDIAAGLAEWSDVLGAARDAEVLQETLATVCPTGLQARLEPSLARSRTATGARLGAELASPAHRELLDDLEGLALRPKTGTLHVRRRVRRAAGRARKRLVAAGTDADLLHGARKAAKRARYAAEAAGDAETARHWEKVQDALGEHHDCAVALRRLTGVRAAGAAAARRELQARAAAALGSLG